MKMRVVAVAAATVAAVTMPSTAGSAPHAADAAKTESVSRSVGIESLSAVDQAIQRAQEPLLRLNDRVFDQTAEEYDVHFAGASIDAEHRSLTVYWSGKVPNKLITLASEAALKGITLAMRPARFSRSQLMRAASELVPSSVYAGTQVGVDIATDGSGLTVVAGDLPAVTRGAKVATALEAGLLDRIAATRSRTGIPVAVAAERPGKPQFTSRNSDTSPYWAGARIRLQTAPNSSNYQNCTSGFSMYNSGTPSVRYTLTAAHCPNFADGLKATNGTGDLMGYSAFVHELYDNDFVAYDLGTVRLNAGRTNAPYIYVGNEVSDGKITVSGYASGGVPAGGNYCVHGITAVNCQLVSGGTHMDCGNDPAPWPPLGRCVYTIDFHSQNANTVVICQGDSGGPIYYWTGGTVIAAGVVSWGRFDVGVLVYSPLLGMSVPCAYTGGLSVVATAVGMVPGLRVVTSSTP